MLSEAKTKLENEIYSRDVDEYCKRDSKNIKCIDDL